MKSWKSLFIKSVRSILFAESDDMKLKHIFTLWGHDYIITSSLHQTHPIVIGNYSWTSSVVVLGKTPKGRIIIAQTTASDVSQFVEMIVKELVPVDSVVDNQQI